MNVKINENEFLKLYYGLNLTRITQLITNAGQIFIKWRPNGNDGKENVEYAFSFRDFMEMSCRERER
jgi:hypothetical protein